MVTQNKFLTTSGIHYDEVEKKFVNTALLLDLPEDESPVGFGKSLTPPACSEMIRRDFFKKLKSLIERHKGLNEDELVRKFADEVAEETHAVEYGKETLLRILSQKDCVGIRFAFCINDEGKQSIVAMGLELDKLDPKKAVPIKSHLFQNQSSKKTALIEDDTMPMVDEKGNGRKYADYVTTSSTNLKTAISDALKEVKEGLTDLNGLHGLHDIANDMTNVFFAI